jgi:fatty-acyl-CoA synthase
MLCLWSDIEMNAPIPAIDLSARNGLAHVIGDTGPTLWHETISSAFKRTVRNFPSQDAAVFVEQGERFTWAELDEEVDALAAGFLKLGLKKGDRLGIWAPNRYEWLLTQFATARVGIVLVTINPAYRLSEIEYAINKVNCKALVTAANFKSSDYIGMLQELLPELADCPPGNLRAAKMPDMRIIIRVGDEKTPGMFNFDNIVNTGRDTPAATLDAITATLEPNEAINVQFTSGTTGAPKGATLSHINVVNNGRFAVATQNFTEKDRLCIPVPLYHCFGMVLGVMGCMATGACMVFASEQWRLRNAPLSMACRPCSSACWATQNWRALIFPACAPASWRARLARLR